MTLLKRAFAAGLAAVLLALVLTPAPQIASAHPSHPVTTVLLPGFNLAGWIEPEASVDVLFEVLPELKAVYAWDAVEQRYRSSWPQRAGDLTTLTPGMGLWLDIDGDQPIFWTRTATPDPATGLVTLRAGWNLVAWYGSENESFEHAFATLDADSQFVLAWDAESQWFVSHVPGAASTGGGVVRVGDAVWVSSPVERHWLQPGSVVPRVEFYGGFPAERKAEIRAETLSVVTWFAERYGLLEPDFILFVGADRSSLDQARREFLDIQDPSDVQCGEAVNNLVFVADWCATATHDVSSPLAHEYFHVLQTHLVALTPAAGTVYVADWLLEGTAEYEAIEYQISRGHITRHEVEQALDDVLSQGVPDLRQLESDIPGFDRWSYLGAMAAVRLAVSEVGEGAVISFFRNVPAGERWQDAFQNSFNSSTSEFYASFAEYAAQFVTVVNRVTVTALLPDGTALREWNGHPLRAHASSASFSGSATMEEGGAELEIPDGTYSVTVSAVCRVFGGPFHASAYRDRIGSYTLDGTPRTTGAGVVLVVAGEDLAITVNLAGSPGELKLNCYNGPRFNIEGRVTNASGEPLEGYDVNAYALTHRFDQNSIDLNHTDQDGRFTIAAPDGHTYAFQVQDSCGTFIGIYHEAHGLIEWSVHGGLRNGTQIPVDGADVTGIEIVIPSSVIADRC
ncbi:MAG: carboxypeptidase regulatory-like domain-containing protein [Dehalococcoidia bacterium]|nr:carboxypeptidase regulatory-like domain-containing protein [Dehalococcoidia bacterium]MYD29624.1 carboxypeptidase regulatory-like domain-containing protein [Dehalococcoidia bacterium]